MGFKPMVIFVWQDDGGRPDQGLPGQPPYPDQGLPGSPPGIWPNPPGGGNRPSHPIAPGGGSGNRPDNSLPPIPPDGLPSHPIAPGGQPPGRPVHLPALPDGSQIVVWWPGHGWVAVPISPGKPDNTLPGSQPGIDNTLPGEPPKPDQGLPPTPETPPPDAPTPTPQKFPRR